jgi:hypothetical protein
MDPLMEDSAGHGFFIDNNASRICGSNLFVERESSHAEVRRSFRIDNADSRTDPFLTRSVDNCGNVLNGRFAAEVRGCTVFIRVRVALFAMNEAPPPPPSGDEAGIYIPPTRATPAAVLAQADQWREIIRAAWTGKHQIRVFPDGCADCSAYDVDIDVVFSVSAVPAAGIPSTIPGIDAIVRVHTGSGHADSKNLYMAFENSAGDQIVAHEFGHWIGLGDEYPNGIGDLLSGSSCRTVTTMDSIMWNAGGKGRVYLFHYHFFADYLDTVVCCDVERGSLVDIVMAHAGGRGVVEDLEAIWSDVTSFFGF